MTGWDARPPFGAGNFQPSLDVILCAGGLYARLWALPFPLLRIWVCLLFSAHSGRGGARKIRQGFHLSAQFLLRMEFDWMDRGPGLGMQERPSCVRAESAALLIMSVKN